MQIVRRKSGFKFKLGVAVVLLLSMLTISKTYLTEELFIVIDKAMVYDLGFSNPKGLGQSIPQITTRLASKSPEIVSGYLFGFPDRPEMERLDVVIKFIDYKKIIADQQRAIRQSILTSPTEVSAKVIFRDLEYKADLRLKGDLRDHWRSSIRMSFRVGLKTKGTIKDFRSFSIHKPRARQYPFDQVYQGLVKEAGLLATTHEYVHLFVNGEDWGIMNIEEHMSKELLEKQKRKESLIFKFGNDEKWAYTDQFGLRNNAVALEDKPYNDGYRLSDPKIYMSAYKSKKYFREPKFRNYYSYVIEHMAKDNSLFDVDAFTQNYLMAKSWNYVHALLYTNSRYYLNPYTLNIEPISMDQGVPSRLTAEELEPLGEFFSDVEKYYPGLSNQPNFRANFADNFNHVKAAMSQVEEVNDEFADYFPINRPMDTTIISDNVTLLEQEYGKQSDFTLGDYVPPASAIQTPTVKHARQIPAHTAVWHYTDGRIRIFNLLPVPLKVLGLYNGEEPLEANLSELPSYLDQPYIDIQTDKTGVHDSGITLVTELLSEERSTTNEYSLVPGLKSPFVESIPEAAREFVTLRDNVYHFSPGTWQVREPIVLDKSVVIAPGSELRFSNAAYLMIKGSLQAQGDADNPIVLAADDQSETWGGLYVRLAEQRSHLDYVTIRDTHEFSAGILALTGGVTFYKSDVTIDHSNIGENHSEDALNIIESDFLIVNSTFSDSPSDAFDSDFSVGLVQSSSFSAIEGDALDYSGSVVEMKDLDVWDIKDKAVSGGEGSTLLVTDCRIKNANIAFASKDGSVVTAKRNTIESTGSYDLMAYQKKSFWGLPELYADNMSFEGEPRFMRQTGAQLNIDGESVPEETLDVKALYQEE